MGLVKVLPSNISNLIAAGEVIQRPSSAVKELMENSVDAGAKNISVNISNGGRTLIQVIDDGCGMGREDALLCFERHATSKIKSAEDIARIGTFGFRGEALSSIVSVADVELKTRRECDEIGICVSYRNGEFKGEEAVSCPVGTIFEIRDIFFNIPARRRFLKSDVAEFSHITSEFLRVALTRNEINFKLTHNGKTIYHLNAVQNIKQRIQNVIGRELTSKLAEVNTQTNLIDIQGFIGTPDAARKVASNQYLFVNKRFFRSPYLHKAICRAYENLIPEGYSPSYFLYLDIDLERVDVNIHPTKTEIKFEDEQTIFQIVLSAIRESIGRNSFGPSIDFDLEGTPEIPTLSQGNSHPGYTPKMGVDYSNLFNPFTDGIKNFESEGFDSYKKQSAINENITETSGSLFNGKRPYSESIGDPFTQHTNLIVHNKYIVTTVKSGLLLINIKRAYFRILYERYMNMLQNDSIIAQQTLFPQEVTLPLETYTTLIDNLGNLSKYGFDIEDLGDNRININALPDGYVNDKESLASYIEQFAELLREGDVINEYTSSVAARLARGGSMGKFVISNNEAQILVDQLFACSEPSFTPEGKKCMTIITIDQLESILSN